MCVVKCACVRICGLWIRDNNLSAVKQKQTALRIKRVSVSGGEVSGPSQGHVAGHSKKRLLARSIPAD